MLCEGVLYGEDERVAQWVNTRCGGTRPYPPYVGLGVVSGDELIAGAMFFGLQDQDILVTIAATSPHAARRGVFRRVLAYPFVQLGLPRVTAEIVLDNRRCLRLAEWLGFRLEGIKRGIGVGVYGLLKEEFRL